MWYLHAPDRSVPYEVTLKAVNDLHQEGYFKRFGISNFASWVHLITYIESRLNSTGVGRSLK
jgi:aryl-alcohol dehydrogenase-like predicted oxidoreductase